MTFDPTDGPQTPGYKGDEFTTPDKKVDDSTTTVYDDMEYAYPGTSSGEGFTPGNDARFNGIPGDPEVWKDSTTGQIFMMYEVPNTEPPIPLLFEVHDDEALEAFFGDEKVVYDRTLDSGTMLSTGAVRFGTTNNLAGTEGDPWLGFLDRMERAVEVQPWLTDDEVMGLFAGAYLEGRELQSWELETTDWWQERTEAERNWAKVSLADPETAEQKLIDDQAFVRDLFADIGADGNDASVIEWMANRYTMGSWSESYLRDQVEALTSGYYEVDAGLQAFISEGGFEAATSQASHESVRSLWNEWLGPAYQPDEATVAKWATKLRKSADGQEELVAMLRGQRMALYEGYEDPNLTYQDIAGPWRDRVASVWGQRADETSEMFQQIVRMNDFTEANKLLRREGMKQGVSKVWEDAVGATGSNVRRAI